jgi:hypothetical protein
VTPHGKKGDTGSQKRTEQWAERYQELLEYVALHRSMPQEKALRGDSADGGSEYRLAGWVRYQRRRFERGLMPAWQRRLLQQVPGFVWDPMGESWRHQLRLMHSLLKVGGHIPRYRSSDPHERALAAWVDKQRHLHRRGELSAERVAALRQLPFKIL